MSKDVNLKEFLDEIILEVEKELEEETTSGDIAGYETPNAFAGKGDKYDKKTKEVSTQAGYEIVNEARFKWPKKFTLTKNFRDKDSDYQKGEYFFRKKYWGGGMYQMGYSNVNSFSEDDFTKWVKDGRIVVESINEARHIDFSYIIKNLKQYKSGQRDFDGLVDALSVDLGIKQNRKAVKNLESHLHAIGDELEYLSNNDMKGVASELLDMRFENINEISTMGVRAVKRFAQKHGFSVKTKSSRNNDTVSFTKDGKSFGFVDPSMTTLSSLEKQLKIKEDCDKPKKKNRWLELKNDESMHTNKKLAKGMMNLRNQLSEVEKFLGWYNKLKNVNETEASTYWKRTNTNIRKIKERIVNIARNLQELEK